METFRTFNIRYPHKGIVIICFNGPRNDETLFPKIVPCRANGDVFATKAKCLKHGLLHGKMCCCNKNCLMYARLVELFALKTRAFSRRSVNWQKSAQSEKRIERPRSGGKSAVYSFEEEILYSHTNGGSLCSRKHTKETQVGGMLL